MKNQQPNQNNQPDPQHFLVSVALYEARERCLRQAIARGCPQVPAESAGDKALDYTENAILQGKVPPVPPIAVAYFRRCFWGGRIAAGRECTGFLERERRRYARGNVISLNQSPSMDGDSVQDRVPDPAPDPSLLLIRQELAQTIQGWMVATGMAPAERDALSLRLFYDLDWEDVFQKTRARGNEPNLRRWGARQLPKLAAALRESHPDLDPAHSPETGSFSFLSYFRSKSDERVWPSPVVVFAPVPQNAAKVARLAAARRASSGAPRRQVSSIQPKKPTQVRCLLGQARVFRSNALTSGGASASSSSVGAGTLSGAKRSQLRRQLARKRSGSGRGSSSSWETKAVGVANSRRRRSGTGT